MSRILAVASTKGGTGKSTLAANLAVEAARAGESVLLVDTDPQASSALFVAARGDLEPGVPVLQMTQPVIHRELPAIADHHDLVVIDTGGRDSTVWRSAVATATDVLIPIRPAAFDLWAVDEVLEALDQLETNVYAVLVQVVARTKLAGEALDELRRILRRHEGRLLRTRIGSRVAWAAAAGAGLAVTEYQPRSLAADELRGIVKELKLWQPRKRR